MHAFMRGRHYRRLPHQHGRGHRAGCGPGLSVQRGHLGTHGYREEQQEAGEQEFNGIGHGQKNYCRNYRHPYEAGMNPATNFAVG